MKIITQLDELSTSPLPESVKKQLHHHFTEPFNGDAGATDEYWQEYSTKLILLEEQDTDLSITVASDDVQYLLQFISDYPEYVLLINDQQCDFIIALAIINDSGSGVYLASPINNPSYPVKRLLPLAQSI